VSAYEKYDETSRHYDHTRVPVGLEIILGGFARQDKPLDRLVVLDAGCGTGAYSRAIVDHVGRVEAIDMSRGMLAVARAKLAEPAARGRVRFHRGSISQLPFAAESFDAAMINQVLHHLDDDPAAGFPMHRRVMAEFARVLRRGGALVINSCSQVQLRDGAWYVHLVPRAAEALRRRFAPLEALRAMLEDVGFVHHGRFVPADAVALGGAYFDGRGPLSEAWRAGDSTWALAGDEELAEALRRVRELDEAGGLADFVAAHDARRSEIGQVTFLLATRA
jgi:ubiquinone/menaquinone biosynthesis C-methylase UbiE